MQYKERVYSIRSASSPVGGQGVWSEEKVCIINNITAVQGGRVCSTRRGSICSRKRRLCRVRREYSIRRVTCAVEKLFAWCEEKVCSITNVTSAVPGGSCLP